MMERMLTRKKLVLFFFFGILGWIGPGGSFVEARPTAGEFRWYVVQPGDSCWSISQRLFGNPKKYEILHKYNDLGPQPHILKPGQRLKVPGKMALPDARLVWLKKKVRAKPPRSLDWLGAKKGMELWKLYKVSTGGRSAARIQFEDARKTGDKNSSLRMREHALLVIYGRSASSASLKRRTKSKIVVKKGIVRGGLGSLYADAGMSIETPSSKIDLQAQNAQIEVDKGETSIVSIYKGKAEVSAQGAKVKVPENFGTFVKKGKKPAKPRRLPSAPRWKGAKNRHVVFAPAGYTETFRVYWLPVKRASRYRVELSRDRRFRSVSVDAVVGAGVQGLKMQPEQSVSASKGFGVGTYYVRVATIDANKLESRPSKIMRVDIVPMKTSRRLQRTSAGVYQVVGLLRMEPPSGKSTEVSFNGGDFKRFDQPLRLTEPGLYELRFRTAGERAIYSILKVRLLRLKAEIVAPKAPMKVGGAGAKVSLKLTDELKRPAVPAELKLMAYPGGELSLKWKSAGVYETEVPALKAYPGKEVILVASWSGGDLAEVSIPVSAPPQPRAVARVVRRLPPPPPKPKTFDWPELPSTTFWTGVGGSASRSARPVTHVGLAAGVAEGLGANAHRPAFLLMALQGGVTFLQGRLGVDAQMPWVQYDMIKDTAGTSKLGDFRLGTRFLAVSNEQLHLSPSLRLTFPTGGFSRDRKEAVFEPGLLFEWKAQPWLLVSTNQIFLIASDFGQNHSLFYSSTYGLEVRFLKILTFALELDMSIGLSGPGDLGGEVGLGLSSAFRVHFDRVRIGLVGGVGLNDAARKNMGGYSVGLTFDVGFRGL